MQCYEYRMMLTHVHNVIVSVDKSFRYDEQLLDDILSHTGIDNLQDLLNLDQRELWLHSLPSVKDLGRAA